MTLVLGAALLPWLALAPFAAALLLTGVRNKQPKLAAWLAGFTALGALALLLTVAPAVFAGEVLRWSVDWLPALGLRLGFRLDGLAWMFALLVLGTYRPAIERACAIPPLNQQQYPNANGARMENRQRLA